MPQRRKREWIDYLLLAAPGGAAVSEIRRSQPQKTDARRTADVRPAFQGQTAALPPVAQRSEYDLLQQIYDARARAYPLDRKRYEAERQAAQGYLLLEGMERR